MIGKKILLIIILTTISLNNYAQRIFHDDYFMVSVDDTKMYRQSNDTLYLFKCSPDFKPFFNIRPSSHFKILSHQLISGYSILKLERLDTIQLTTDPYPLTRYQVLAFNTITADTTGQLTLFKGLTKKQLDEVNIPNLTGKFFSTLISRTYKKKLEVLKSVVTKQDAATIIATLKSNKYNNLVNNYKSTNINDMYNSIINAELLYHACIDNGYNPINASNKIGAILKEK
ncbi:hypothetical protein [Mucilaginibacter glaciei]|uniref:Uncharacterized protein n=1 Tax=Mucilaginibacter glaciei TaxID=2772109 RepID=A0A926NJ95_9SPHI|nr:hypothetical protein [Mucilaginibacter glaciei]MBD1392241.1 hypothetical protein [Mucilaginibacter glaciei]